MATLTGTINETKSRKAIFRRHFVGRVLLREFIEKSCYYFGFIGLCVVSKMSKRRIEVLDPFIKKKRFVYRTFVISYKCHALKTFRLILSVVRPCFLLKLRWVTIKINFISSRQYALARKLICHSCIFFVWKL